MTREDAIFFLNGLRSNNNCDETIDMAIDALRGPEWVRTADRVPTKADANKWGNVATVFYYITGEARVVTWPWDLTAQEPENYPYWMPLPKLPEEEK